MKYYYHTHWKKNLLITASETALFLYLLGTRRFRNVILSPSFLFSPSFMALFFLPIVTMSPQWHNPDVCSTRGLRIERQLPTAVTHSLMYFFWAFLTICLNSSLSVLTSWKHLPNKQPVLVPKLMSQKLLVGVEGTKLRHITFPLAEVSTKIY